MRRITKVAAIAATALTALIATAGSASAATTDANGVITISKDEIKSAMGWKNEADWLANTDTPQEVNTLVSKVTAMGATPVDVPGGWLTLNGQIVANYPSDEYYSHSFDNPENWGPNGTPVSSYWTTDSATIKVTPTYGGSKLNGLKVTAVTTPDADGYVYYTRHTTMANPDYAGAQWVYHATSRWPANVAGSGVTIAVNGKPVTVNPYVAPAV